MDISIHEAERLERKGRRFLAVAVLSAVAIIGASWFGLITFLGMNSAWGTIEDVRDIWIPDVEQMTLDLPNLTRLSEVYTADGVLLGKLTERNSQPLPLDDIPNLVIGAVLSAEDADFMTHRGIDHQAIIRAFVQNVGGGITQGGSTITQQVVKQNFVGSEPTLERKVAEAAIAIELERRYTKEQILGFYLNSVFFGWNAYGVQAAAQEYFGKPLDELTIAEAAALTVPIRNPSLYDLRRDSEIPLRARNRVIDEMAEEGYITDEEAEQAKDQPLRPIAHQEFPELAPQVLIAAKEALLNDPAYGLGSSYLQRKQALFGCPAEDTACQGGGGLRITTSVDYVLQQQALEILRGRFPPGSDLPTGAIAMVDNRTGATVVMASGLEFGADIEAGQREYDLATKGRRNPGSSFKPFGLIAALENGIPLRSWWDYTTPKQLDTGIFGAPVWNCRNAGTNEPGIRTLENALVYSTNTVFCQVAVEVGADTIAEVAHRMGIRSPIDDQAPAIVLGASAVSPLEMASAYSTIANYGARVDNYLIERIEDADGNVLYQHRPTRTQVLDEALTAAVVNTMEQAVGRGTGGAAYLGRPQAGKTGTHESYTDVWFMGFIPQYTTAVWVGYPDSQVPMRNITIDGVFHARAFGGAVAAPIWRDFMEIVVDDLPVEEFPPDPEGTEVFYQTPRVEVPDVIGLDLEDAEEELLEAGLNVESEAVNSEEPVDTVLSSDPEPRTRIRQGSTITIEVSNGLSPEAPLPDLVGNTRAQAVATLEALREATQISFEWTFFDVPVGDPLEANLVTATSPPPGSIITEETTVVVTVTMFDPAVEPPPDDGETPPGHGG
jgi:penicillin-binding protein 1A